MKNLTFLISWIFYRSMKQHVN